MKMRLLTKMLLFVLVPALIGLVVVAAVNYGASRIPCARSSWQT